MAEPQQAKPKDYSANGADAAKSGDKGRDGVKIVDPWAYNLLGVPADATEAQLKSAYKKAALKHHPDRNRDDPNAESRFQEIGEAFQILSDSNLRAVYDKRGRKSDDARPEEGFTDPGQLFAQLFGGERFNAWIGEISLGRDFSKAMDISMSEEEKAAYEAEISGKDPKAEAAKTVQGETAAATTTGDAAPGTSTPASANGTTTSSELHKAEQQQPGKGKHPSKESSKMTAEQKAKMDELARERQKNEHERIVHLIQELKDRVRPFVQARNPGDLVNDPECAAWEKRIREEVEDLKGESFGLELCRLIGGIYVGKSSAYLKTHKSPLSNFLGLGSWWGKMKDRGSTIKEGWSFLSASMDVQRAMAAMEASEKDGGEAAAAQSAQDEAFMGKIMLVTWKGTKFEVANVLRQVVDGALRKEAGMSEVELVNRAKAILIIGSIMSNVQVDETDEERREMERLVAKAAAERKAPKKSKKEKA